MRVMIIGGGIGGLATALSLHDVGISCTVFEQVRELRELGVGINTLPHAIKELAALGLLPALDRAGIRTRELIYANRFGQVVWRELRGTDAGFDAPQFSIHRGKLHGVLLAAVQERLGADAVRTGCRLVSFTERGDALVARFEQRDGGDAFEAEGDALIGADGIHSVVRQTLFGSDKAEFTGFMAWRGLCPKDKLPPALMRHGGWIAPNSHIMHYPVRKGAMLNVIAVVERDDWQKESWYDRGTHQEWIADFTGWHDDARAMISATAEPFKWALMVHWPAERWSVGHVTLLGDACHSTLPFLAQGGSMSIEDGYVLARCLAEFDDVETALKRYEAARVERTKHIVLASVDQKDRLHGEALKNLDTAKQHVDEKWTSERMAALYDGIYGYDAVSVAI